MSICLRITGEWRGYLKERGTSVFSFLEKEGGLFGGGLIEDLYR